MTNKKRTSGKSKVKSKIEVEKKKINNNGSLPDREGKPWTKGEIDQLLDLFFDEQSWMLICRRLQRSQKSIETKLWKVFSQYANEIYQPNTGEGYKRLGRASSPWSNRELGALSALEGKLTVTDLAQLLQRLEVDVIDTMQDSENNEKGATLFSLEGGEFVPTKVVQLPKIEIPPETIDKLRKAQSESIPGLRKETIDIIGTFDCDETLDQQFPKLSGDVVDEEFDGLEDPIEQKPKALNVTQHEGKKYLRLVYPADGEGEPILIDVYSVLDAFDVHGHGIAHAIKKLLCAGQRGKGSKRQDLVGAIAAISRAIDRLDELEKENEK